MNDLDVNRLLGASFWILLFEQQFILVGQLFRETGKLISEQNEIIGVFTVDFQDAKWMSTNLCEKAYRITNDNAYVFSDSVLALCGKNWR